MRTLTRDAAGELAAAACTDFAAIANIGKIGGPDARIEVEELVSRPWASITFSGARHMLWLRIDGPGAAAAADRFLDGLGEREFPMRGHLLADIVAASDERTADAVRLRIEALTVEV